MEIYPAGVPHHVPGAVQHRGGAGAVGAVCVFPGYPVHLQRLFNRLDVCHADFYPINQLPFRLMWLIKHFNPLYAYITQFRTIVLEGVFPDERLILYGVVMSAIMLGIGSFAFVKTQDKFYPLYIGGSCGSLNGGIFTGDFN